MANFTSKLSNLRCFEAFYAAFVLKNFCWRGRCEFEAWLNFIRAASRSHFLELFIEILSKELVWWQMVVWQGSSSKIESFCHGASCGYFCLIARGCVVYVWLLGDEEICSKCVASEKFHGTCNFDVVRLNNEVLLPTEQILNFNQPDDKEFNFWQEIVKFYKFKPHLNFSYQILLPHKTKAVKSFAKSILKR